MKKLIIPILLSFTLLNYGFSSILTPDLKWSKNLGGTSQEVVGGFGSVSQYAGRHASVDIDKTNNNIYIATTSGSSDGYVGENHGEEDVWLVCLDMDGDTLWTRVFGGNGYDRTHRVRALEDGGGIVVISSNSQDGSFSNALSGPDFHDAFLIRFDEAGEIVWSNVYGGSDNSDFLYDIIETSDGHLIACGESYSTTNDLSGSGDGMNWAIKIDYDGEVVWSRTFLGADGSSPDWLENAYRLTELENNDIILTGYTTPDFNNWNLDRISVISIDLNGNLNWVTKIGDEGGGDYPTAIKPLPDNKFYILGSLEGTVDEGEYNYYGGSSDFWLVKMDHEGNMISENNYGGTNFDVPYDFAINDNNDIYMVGLSRSYDNDAYREGDEAPEGFIPAHYWLLKIDSDGNQLYNKRFGGSSNDFATGISLSDDNMNLIIVGCAESDDGDIENHIGSRDLWVLNLEYEDFYNVIFGVEAGEGSITATVDGNSITSPAQVEEGAEIIFNASPGGGYEIIDWHINGAATGSTDSEYIIDSLDDNIEVMVEFEEIDEPEYYIVTFGVEDGSGDIIATANGDTIESGDEIIENSEIVFMATADEGYQVADWHINGDATGSTDNEYLINSLIEDIEVMVEFEEIPVTTYNVSFGIMAGEGDITATVGDNEITSPAEVEEGDEIEFTAIPDEGYKIADWHVNGAATGSTDSEYIIDSLDDHIEVMVEFEEETFVKDYNKTNFSVYPNPANSYLYIDVDSKTNIYIKDIKGSIVISKTINNKQKISLDALNNGVYFINATNRNLNATEKIIIAK